MATNWQGGAFTYAPQWSSGRSNSGSGSSKNPALRKSGRFNPNPTRCSHAGCQIAARSLADKKKHLDKIKSK